jgi:cob(I)alamin adenosyltransferase
MSDVDRARLDAPLAEVQNDLFDLGADLATPAADRWPTMQRLGPADATRMENWIDAFNDELPPLKEFVLPGGGVVGSFLHQARTVCRRAERIVVTLRLHADDVGDGGLIYLNRLSDLLFVLGRWAAKAGNVPEVLWAKRTSS